MTNVLFVCFFYSALLPAAYIFGFAILLVQYNIDKFCLLRIWRRSPPIGPDLAKISRRYFFTTALLVFLVSSAYTWAQMPYNNVCNLEGGTVTETRKEFNNIILLDGSTINVTVFQEEPVYFCSQDIQDSDGLLFPPIPKMQPDGLKWMDDAQVRNKWHVLLEFLDKSLIELCFVVFLKYNASSNEKGKSIHTVWMDILCRSLCFSRILFQQDS